MQMFCKKCDRAIGFVVRRAIEKQFFNVAQPEANPGGMPREPAKESD